MKNHSQEFLEQLASHPADTFESRFSLVSNRLGLASTLNRNELTLLYEAAFRATLCNMALNGLGEYGEEIRPELEANRTKLEWDFMVARDMFYGSPGWQELAEGEQELIKKVFLSVFVAEDKLA